MEDDNGHGGLTDYKIHCFNGIPKAIQVISGRFGERGINSAFYSPEWENLNIGRAGITDRKQETERPARLESMKELAGKLAGDTKYLRVDLYIVSGEIYFGELTFFPGSGFVPFVPEKWDRSFGEWIRLGQT